MYTRYLRVGALVALSGALAACASDSPVAPEQDLTTRQFSAVTDAAASASAASAVVAYDRVLNLGSRTTLTARSSITRWRTRTWTSSQSTVVSVNSDGRIEARGQGAAVITVRSAGGTQSWNVYALDAANASLGVSPSSASLRVGQTLPVVATLTTSTGDELSMASAILQTGNTSVATVSPDRLLVGMNSGATQLTVSAYGISRQVPVTVSSSQAAPTLSAIGISPKSAQATVGGSVQFAASALWTDGSATLPALSWSAPQGGTISASGVYSAPSVAGTYRVIVSANGGSLLDTALIAVAASAPSVTSFVLSPGTASVNIGATQQFSTATTWSDGQSRASSVTYTATGGTITVGGMYTAGQVAGTFAVIASCACGTADTTLVAVTSAARLSWLAISPGSVAVAAGGSYQFVTTARWSTGATALPPVTYTATGGTINATTGLYSAPSAAGTYQVFVSQDGGTIRDTANVTVAAPVAQLTSLAIAPASVSLAAGASQQFTTTARWNTGATTLPPLTYTATGGTINASTGLYTAPTTAGTYQVFVTHTGGTVRDTAQVTVTSSSGGGGTTTTTTTTPPPSFGAFTANLPANNGLHLVTDTRFGNLQIQQLNADGLAYVWDGRNATDASAPYGSSVFETFYPGNDFGNGVGGAKVYNQEGNNWRKVYFSMAMWVPSNYSIHSNGEKFFYPLITTNGAITGSAPINFAPIVGGPSGSNFGFVMIPRPGSVAEPQNGAAMVPKGQWAQVEFYMEMNTPGSSNGVLKVWVNGQVATNRSDIMYSGASTQSVFDGIRFDGTRGGGVSNTPTPAGGQVRRYNRLAFYAAP
jgi:hypothetical protein